MRPVGWRYDSVRHSLAARGYRTRAYFVTLREKFRTREGVVSLYHGTPKENVEGIKRGGLVPGSFGYLWLTPRVKVAADYARYVDDSGGQMYGGEKGEIFVVKIPVEKLERDAADYEIVESGPGPYRAFGFITQSPVPKEDVRVLRESEFKRRRAHETAKRWLRPRPESLPEGWFARKVNR